MTTENEPPARYTSYHSDKTFSILDKVREYIQLGLGNLFEYNGLQYFFRYSPQDTTKPIVGWRLTSRPMDTFQSPDGSGVVEKPTLRAEFDGNKFDEFIETFEIEGKTVKWILEHQKEWKYKFSAKHLEDTLTGFSFWFIYRGLPCGMYYAGGEGKKKREGRYLAMFPLSLFDVTQYAPLVPGKEHWVDAAEKRGVFDLPEKNEKGVKMVFIGPFKTDGELLDAVQLNSKTLRDIFDTEYDDGAVCCGMFDG